MLGNIIDRKSNTGPKECEQDLYAMDSHLRAWKISLLPKFFQCRPTSQAKPLPYENHPGASPSHPPNLALILPWALPDLPSRFGIPIALTPRCAWNAKPISCNTIDLSCHFTNTTPRGLPIVGPAQLRRPGIQIRPGLRFREIILRMTPRGVDVYFDAMGLWGGRGALCWGMKGMWAR